MRYIRTKDGRIIDTAITPISLGYHPREADTIEELCDEFVALLFDDETFYEYPLGYYTEIFEARTHCLQSLIKSYDIDMISVRAIYGAIWTDKGLIYKAKMKGILPNGEIDWELL